MHQELRIIPCTKRVDFAKASVDMVVIDDAIIMFLPYDAPVGMLTSEKLVIAETFKQLGPMGGWPALLLPENSPRATA
jgi:hypothetical protein